MSIRLYDGDEAGRPALVHVDRTCKYGHGTLYSQPGTWALPGHKEGAVPVGGLLGFMTSDLVYAVRIHVCQFCGYVELSDFET